MKTCPQCGYIRKECDEIIRETDCPKCGIIYSKWQNKKSPEKDQTNPSIKRSISENNTDQSKAHFERMVLLILVVVLGLVVTVPQIIKYFQSEKKQSEIILLKSATDDSKLAEDQKTAIKNPSLVSLDHSATAKELSIAEIIRENRESIVVVKTPAGVGSGFFINRNGYVVTNRHVMQQGDQAEIKTIQGSVFRVTRIVYEDVQADLVVLASNASQQESKPVQINSRLPEVGEKVIVVGNPLGLEQTVSDGIVSALRRNQHSVEFIQVTAPISPGNSGGPLLNMHGEVIGVATFQFKTGQNLNFCVGAARIAGMLSGTNFASPVNAAAEIKSPGGQEVYCYVDSNGQVSFVDWKTGLLVSRPDGTLDRVKYENWVMEQIGGHPDNINPDKEAREDLERNRERLFKSVFPHRSLDDSNLTSAEKDWLERRYQRHYVETFNQVAMRRNEAIRKYRSMMNDFDKFAAGRR